MQAAISCILVAKKITIIIIITSSNDIQPSTLITDHSPSGLLLDMEYAGLSPYTLL